MTGAHWRGTPAMPLWSRASHQAPTRHLCCRGCGRPTARPCFAASWHCMRRMPTTSAGCWTSVRCAYSGSLSGTDCLYRALFWMSARCAFSKLSRQQDVCTEHSFLGPRYGWDLTALAWLCSRTQPSLWRPICSCSLDPHPPLLCPKVFLGARPCVYHMPDRS